MEKLQVKHQEALESLTRKCVAFEEELGKNMNHSNSHQKLLTESLSGVIHSSPEKGQQGEAYHSGISVEGC